MDNICGICGINLKEKYTHTLPKCNHTFHYECLMKSLIHNYNEKNCPYCRTDISLLPPVNGLNKLYIGIHDTNLKLESERCNHVIIKGKRKGQKCGKKCKLGYYQCSIHLDKSN